MQTKFRQPKKYWHLAAGGGRGCNAGHIQYVTTNWQRAGTLTDVYVGESVIYGRRFVGGIHRRLGTVYRGL